MKKPAMRLLYVDNNRPMPHLHDVLRAVMADWQVDRVASLHDAAVRLERGGADAILLPLPDTNGDPATTLRRLGKVDARPPIVILTTKDDAELGVEAMRCGADAHFTTDQMDEWALAGALQRIVTDKRLESVVRDRDAIKQSLTSMERTMAVVGHELRTPLAGLRATTEFLLTDEAKQAAEWDPFLQLMHDEVIRMAELVNNLLEAARLNSGQTQWRWSEINLSRVCDEALNVVRPLIDHVCVELRWNIDPPDMTMRGDAEAICRLIINFISNAAKHTKEGSITLDLTSQSHNGRPYVIMRFLDTGPGISPTLFEKLGKAFVLNDGSIGSDYAKGIGLGLSICRGIVAVHGGTIKVATQPDQGCTFIVSLPADLSGPIESDDAPIQLAA